MEESTELPEYPFNVNDIKDNQVNLEKETDDSLFVLNKDIKTESFTLRYFSNQNLENNQILDTQGVFLNESSFVQSGHLTGVQAKFNDSMINEHFGKEKFAFYGSDVFYSLNQKAFIIDQLGFKPDTNKPLPTINIERITDDSRALDIVAKQAMSNINNATKYYSFSQSDATGSYENFSGNLPIISDKTPRITAKVTAVKDLKVSLIDANLNEIAINPSKIHISSGGTFSYTPNNELRDGAYTLKMVGKSDDGTELSSNLNFTVDTTPIKFENIHIEKDANSGANLISFNLSNFSDNDKFENIKAYIQNYDINGDLIYSNSLELAQNKHLANAKYDLKLNFGDVLKIEATDAAGTTHTHINKILIPTFTQLKSDHDTSVNSVRSVEKWDTVELNDNGFKADGSRIIINDDKPYFRAIIPDTSGFGTEVIKHKDEIGYQKPAYIQVVAKKVDSSQEINLDFQVIERPVDSTPQGYLRLTGYSDKLSTDRSKDVKLEDGVYELRMKGSYQNGDIWFDNPIKFTVDSNAPKFENLSLVMNFDQARNKTFITGKITDHGVSSSYKLLDHFGVDGDILKDSFEIYANDGTKTDGAQNLVIDSDGNFSVEYSLDVTNDGFYTALKDIAGNTTVLGNDQDNLIITLNGDDDIVAGGGNDVVNSGDGADIVQAGVGDDVVYGGLGDDMLHGNEGNDEIHGDDGRDEIYGDNGNDEIYGGKGADRIYGNDGDDTIYGEDGDDEIDGNDGDDTIYGGFGGDLIRGGNGNDTIIAGAGNDRIYGREGDNIIDAGEGNDTVYLDISNLGTQHKLSVSDANGGSGIDTLVLNPIGSALVDFSKMAQTKFSKIKNFEKIDLGGALRGIEIKGLDVKDLLDINDGKDVVLKFEGDNKDKIHLKDNFTKLADQTGVENGYVRYGNNATLDTVANSVKIDVDKDILTDFI